MVPPGGRAAVNGLPLSAGLHVLSHKDEIRLNDGSAIHFSVEVLPQPRPYLGPAAKCGRCHTALEPGCPVVHCSCGVAYHHGSPSCFEYGKQPLCVACRRPTRMDGSGLWRPEEEA
jgi:hypothetical protein